MGPICFAGQLTGLEGYIGRDVSGLLAGKTLFSASGQRKRWLLPRETMMGASHYISDESVKDFQPMGANFEFCRRFRNLYRDKHESVGALAKDHRSYRENHK